MQSFPSVFLFSFFIPVLLATLSGMGVGGGGLFVIYLCAVLGMPWLEAQTLNLAFFLFAALAALVFHLQKRKIFFGAIALMTLCGFVASPIGSSLAFALPTDALRKMLGCALIAFGVLSLLRKNKKNKSGGRDTTK